MLHVEGLHVLEVARTEHLEWVKVESDGSRRASPGCGQRGQAHRRDRRELHDAPIFGGPCRLVWLKRVYRCRNTACERSTFSEPCDQLVAPGGKPTRRAIGWVIARMGRDLLSVEGAARQLGVDWHTVWDSVQPHLVEHAGNQARLSGVTRLGVNEHIWTHIRRRDGVPKEMTAMVDLTADEQGKTRARLLDLTQGRSGKAYGDWLAKQPATFRDGIKVTTLDPFRGYQNAIDEHLSDSVSVLDAFHIVKKAGDMLDEVRRRVQNDTLGHRGGKGDPLYGIRLLLRASAARLTDRQQRRLAEMLAKGDPDGIVLLAWQMYQQTRALFHDPNLSRARTKAEALIATLVACPIPEIARFGRTLRQWKKQFLAYFTTGRSNNGGTEAINGIIELVRRIARGFRNPDNYRLRMILTTGGPHLEIR